VIDDETNEDEDAAAVEEVLHERPLLRSRDYKPGHRQTPPPAATGPSPWERPRENFTKSFEQRSNEMSNTREGRRVPGNKVNW